jgi:transcriptional regulator of acetoin/glycerol metabolism
MQTHVGLQVMARFEGEAARDGARQLLEQATHVAETNDVMSAPASLRTLECQAIERTLAALGGNVSATAKALGISRNTIYRRRQAGSGQAS